MEHGKDINETDQAKQNKIEQIKKFCAELDPDIKVLIVGAGAGEAAQILKAMNGVKTPLEHARLISEHNAIESSASMVTEDMIRKMYNRDQLCVIVEDADRVMGNKLEKTYSFTNPYKDVLELTSGIEYIGRDPKTKPYDKPKFMGESAPVVQFKKNGNNRNKKKRKKAKNGRKRK